MKDERLLAQFENIFQTFSLTSEGRYIYICDIAEDISYWSQNAVDFFGLPSSKMAHAGELWLDHLEEPYREAYAKDITDLFGGKKDRHEMIYRARDKDGNYVTCTCRGRILFDDEGKPEFFVGTISNHETSDRFDPVTGTQTRASLLDRMKLLQTDKKIYYLLMIGVRNFFDINSTYGFLEGNRIIKGIAEYLMKHPDIKPVNLFRCEGTRFAILFNKEKYSYEDIQRIYNEIREYLQQRFRQDGNHISINISGGCVDSTIQPESPNGIYNLALYALSKAKGENMSDLFLINDPHSGMDEHRIQVLNTIRNSIGGDYKGFYLVYQPIVDAHTQEITGAEALLRWKNEEYGVVPPNEFIPWLEKDPIFYDLGNWILRQAMSDTKKLSEKHPNFIINVNLAYPQLQRSDFKADLTRIVEELQYPPKNLKLELTERCKLLNMNMLLELMIFFNTSGFQTALDDFGTGYSALNLLIDLPITQIKIDRSYILNVENDPAKQSLLKAIVGCAAELGKGVCVEGVENAEMRDFLLEHYPITNIQGYYYSKPLTYDELVAWMEDYDRKRKAQS
jgi:PAS domain S-box-containing protein